MIFSSCTEILVDRREAFARRFVQLALELEERRRLQVGVIGGVDEEDFGSSRLADAADEEGPSPPRSRSTMPPIVHILFHIDGSFEVIAAAVFFFFA